MILSLVIGAPIASAGDNDPITVVWAAESINRTFTAADRAALFTTIGTFSYVEINTFGTFRYSQTPPTGIKVEDLLSVAGVDTAALEADRVITFIAQDSMRVNFTWGQLTEERYTYTYPAGTATQDQLKQGVKNGVVPAIISFNQGSSAPRNFMGITYPSEQFRGVMNQTIATIEVGGLASQWGAPYVFVENGSAASGPPLADGSTVTAGTKLRINNDAHGQGGTSHKYFYTLDGTDPVPGSASTFAFNWNSNSPDISTNPSIVVPEGSGQFVIKAMTIGYGMLDSNIMTFTYNYPVPDNAAFLTGPSELNIDIDDELEYTINVANVADVNMFSLQLSYDAAKLEYKDIDLLLPSSAFVLGMTDDTAAGKISFDIALLANGATFSSTGEAAIANVVFSLKGGAAGDTVEAELLSLAMVNPVTGVRHSAVITGASVSTLLTEKDNYDVNGDGVFDLVDLSIIIFRYFQVSENDALWSEAARFNISPNVGLQIIDTADIIALYSLIGV